MQNILTIYKKEVHSFLSTISGYIFMAAILLAGGIYVYVYNFSYGYANFGESINYISFFFVLLMPLISAGVFAEEKHLKTDQLLYTLPTTSGQVVLGKFFALVSILAIPLLIIGVYPLFMSLYGKVNFAQAYSNLLAIFLLGIALSAICMFISSLVENVIVSGVLCFVVTFALYQMNSLLQMIGKAEDKSFLGFVILALLYAVFIWAMTKNVFIALIPSAVIVIALIVVRYASKFLLAGKLNLVISSLAFFKPLENFKAGIVDVYAIIYYISITVLFVLFTTFVFERRRWNR